MDPDGGKKCAISTVDFRDERTIVGVTMSIRRVFLALGAAGLLLAGGCDDWQRNVTLHGVAFSVVKTEPDGLLIGRIEADTVVGDRPCQKGWLHLYPSGVPAAFTAAQGIAFGGGTIPAGTWVFQHPAGVVTVCAFPRDTEVQGHVCHGTGGPKGVQASFYASGALKQFFPPRPTTIDGVPCDSGIIHGSIELHENGRLKSCLLGGDLVRDSRTVHKGTRIAFDPEGNIQS